MIIRKAALEIALVATANAENKHPRAQAIYAVPGEKPEVYGSNGFVLLIVRERYPYPDAEFPHVAGAEYRVDPAPFTIPLDVVNGLLKVLPKKSTIPILQAVQAAYVDEHAITLAATDLHAPRIATLNPHETGDVLKLDYAQKAAAAAAEKGTVKVFLGAKTLDNLIKAAKLARPHNPVIELEIPTHEPIVKDALGVRIAGDDVEVHGLAMPVTNP